MTEEEDTPWEIDKGGKRYMYFVPIAPDALAPATYQCYKWYHIYQKKTSSIVQGGLPLIERVCVE